MGEEEGEVPCDAIDAGMIELDGIPRRGRADRTRLGGPCLSRHVEIGCIEELSRVPVREAKRDYGIVERPGVFSLIVAGICGAQLYGRSCRN